MALARYVVDAVVLEGRSVREVVTRAPEIRQLDRQTGPRQNDFPRCCLRFPTLSSGQLSADVQVAKCLLKLLDSHSGPSVLRRRGVERFRFAGRPAAVRFGRLTLTAPRLDFSLKELGRTRQLSSGLMREVISGRERPHESPSLRCINETVASCSQPIRDRTVPFAPARPVRPDRWT